VNLLFLYLLGSAFGYVEISNSEYDYVPEEYIITYHLNTTSEEAQIHWLRGSLLGIEFLHLYNTGFHKGFAAVISDEFLF